MTEEYNQMQDHALGSHARDAKEIYRRKQIKIQNVCRHAAHCPVSGWWQRRTAIICACDSIVCEVEQEMPHKKLGHRRKAMWAMW